MQPCTDTSSHRRRKNEKVSTTTSKLQGPTLFSYLRVWRTTRRVRSLFLKARVDLGKRTSAIYFRATANQKHKTGRCALLNTSKDMTKRMQQNIQRPRR